MMKNFWRGLAKHRKYFGSAEMYVYEDMDNKELDLVTELLSRLDRIEGVLLGDPEHNIWGYKTRMEHMETSIENINKTVDERNQLLTDKIDKRLKDMDEKIDINTKAVNRWSGMESIVGLIIGATLGTIITFLLTGGA